MKRPRTLMIVAVALAAGLLVPSASAAPSPSPRWVEVAPSGHPSPQGYHMMAYDSARERTVLFAGNCQCGAQTWEWDGETWRWLDLAVQPLERRHATMAYDEARGEV